MEMKFDVTRSVEEENEKEEEEVRKQ